MDDEVQKMHVKLKQEQQRWDRECVAREKQQVNLLLFGIRIKPFDCIFGMWCVCYSDPFI